MSYSRRDGEFVSRLVNVLEENGQDAWLDTSDIRGSEEWRQSIVGAIRAAEIVVLVISPRSMASTNVQREITVAAEEKRRILPVVMERAELTGSIRYELAGVQHISFEGRPFDEAAAELLEALRTAAAPATGSARSTPSTSPSRAVTLPRSGRRLGVSFGLLAIGAIGLAIVGLLSGNGERPEESGAASNQAVASAAPSGPTAIRLDAAVWFAGYDIKVDGARYDKATRQAVVDVAFTNRQPTNADPSNILFGDTTALEWNGRRFTPFCRCNSLPPSATLDTTLTFDVDDTFDLADAVLLFGGPTQHQARVPLDGQPPTSERPVVHKVAGAIRDGAGSTFTVQAVDVVPGGCSGLADGLGYTPGPVDKLSVVVWLTAETTSAYGVNAGDAFLVLPDGTNSGSLSLISSVLAVYPGRPVRDVGACMTIPAPAGGKYRFVVTANGVTRKPKGLEFEL